MQGGIGTKDTSILQISGFNRNSAGVFIATVTTIDADLGQAFVKRFEVYFGLLGS